MVVVRCLLEPTTEDNGVMDSHPAQRWQWLPAPAPKSRRIHASEHMNGPWKRKEHYVYQEGKAVFKFAVTNMADVSAEIMEKNG